MPAAKPLDQAVALYEREAHRAHIEQMEQERQELIRRFSLEDWPSLPLERYALGQGSQRESYCWWIEFGTPRVGSMKGGNASKHIIYKKRDGAWHFDRKIYKNEQEAWQALRAGFLDAFAKARQGQWDSIDAIAGLDGGPALRTKTLFCYFPDDLLLISSAAHLRHFLSLVRAHHAQDIGYEPVRLNRALLAALRAVPALSGWSTQELSHFLYQWAHPSQQQRVVKIAPGEDARYWDDCRHGDYICVGWDQIGDLRAFESKEAFQSRFRELFGDEHNHHQPTLSKKANEVWMLRELEPGDRVVANRGTTEVLAVGEVVEPGYEWSESREAFRHLVRVKWDEKYAKKIEPQKNWAFVTVAKIPQPLQARILNGSGPKPTIEPVLHEIAEALARKGQAVLYGPPGTSKTYFARRFAVWWLLDRLGQDPSAAMADPQALVRAEKDLLTSQSVAPLTWLTFHPSFSYEDFIEGFRPVCSDAEQLVLRLENGVFKRVCREAQANPSKPYLVLIDEINRANVAKVFGEVITLLEKDKRGLTVTLPQSKEAFAVPPNVYVLGTMNTADRSIKLLDAALRRRFAFLELMPDSMLLAGGKVGNLPLDEFLDALNRRIAAKEGREKQIGHCFLLDDHGPVGEPEEFARRFRQEILPLLQEYCYDDYKVLADYIGDKLVDQEGQRLNEEKLADTDQLIEALEEMLDGTEAVA